MALKVVESKERVTGAAMDQPLPKRRPNYIVAGIGIGVLLVAAVLIWQLIPNGLRVAEDEIRIVSAERQMFRNHIVVRSTAEPLRTVMLDALESGRVEEVLVNDGALVEKGQLLFRLSNPQLQLDLVAREADRAQQISNLSVLRVEIEGSQTDHDRRMLDLNFAATQARKQLVRYQALLKDGFIPAWTLEEAEDKVAQQEQAVKDQQARFAIEMRIKRDGAKQMEQAIERLEAGLNVVRQSIDGLAVRAPISGRLTDFRLQLGEIVKPERRIGRIDDPDDFKLLAQIDEYFLGGVAVGKKGDARVNGRDYPVEISSVFPQINDGRFSIELLFTEEAPTGLNPGQSMETQIVLGETVPALILPNDAFLNDSGGTWVFALIQSGKAAERRPIRIGRRNNSQVEVTSGLEAGERVIVSSYAGFGNAERLEIVR